MTLSYSIRKSLGICVVCPCRAAEDSIRCEFHRALQAARSLRSVTPKRTAKRRHGCCAECGRASKKYRCEGCAGKAKLWDCQSSR